MSFSIWIILAVIFFVIAAILLIVTAMLFVRLEIASVIGFLTGKTQAKQVQEIRAQSLSNSSKVQRKKYNPPGSDNKFEELFYSEADTVERSKMQNIAHASKRLNYTQNTYNKEIVQQPEDRTNDRFSKLKISNAPKNDFSLDNKKDVDESFEDPTGIINENEISNYDSKDKNVESTSILSNTADDESTTLLNEKDTTKKTELYSNEEATTKLDENADEYFEIDKSQSTDILNDYYDTSEGTAVLSSNNDLSETSLLSDNKELKIDSKVKLEIIDDETSVLTDEVIK